MVAKRLDEQSYLVATSKTEWILERHKKRANQILVALKGVKSTQKMAVRNRDPYAANLYVTV